MQIIVLWEGREDPIVLELPEDADFTLFAQLLMAESGNRLDNSHIIETDNQIQLKPTPQPLIYQGISDGSTLFVKRSHNNRAQQQQPQQSLPTPTAAPPVAPPAQQQPPQEQPQQQTPGGGGRQVTLYDIPADVTPEQLLELSRSNPNLLREIQGNDKELGDVLSRGDLVALRVLMMKRFMDRHKQEFQRQQEMMEIERDPMNPELQKKIEEEVKSLSSPLLLSPLLTYLLLSSPPLPSPFPSLPFLYLP